MNRGKSLVELASAVQMVADTKRDYIVPSNKMYMNQDSGRIGFNLIDDYMPNGVFHDQLSTKLDIPKAYYDRMKDKTPILFADSVNTWLNMSTDIRMVRTVGGTARALLSDRYRPLDNDTILETVLPILADFPDLQILSSEVTEKRLYLQVVFPKLTGEVKRGDVVQSGLLISNSEVGLGSVRISPLIYRLVCLNGMVRDTAMRKYHIGRQIEGDQDFYAIDTREADNKAFLLRIRDTIKDTVNEASFSRILARLEITAQNKLSEKPLQNVVEDVTKKFVMPVSSRDSILKNLINGGDLSQWGLANSITALANTENDYDKSVEYETIGGKIIDLTDSEWKVLMN